MHFKWHVEFFLLQTYLNRKPNPRKKLLVPCVLDKPNPKCYVCSEKPEVVVKLNTGTITVKQLEDKVMMYTILYMDKSYNSHYKSDDCE